MPPPPPQLMDELIEEILLRLPPSSTASFVRAGLVCKRWCHLVSDPGFRRRLREHHRSPPILSLLNGGDGDSDRDDNVCLTHVTNFVPEPGSGLLQVDHPGLLPRECRHGRVLLYSHYPHTSFVVWDPITGERVQLPSLSPPLSLFMNRWTAAVLCAAAAAAPGGTGTCDHLDCHGGPFIVVLVVRKMSKNLPISSYVYKSESGAWSEPTLSPLHSGDDWTGCLNSSQLVGNSLYFVPQLLSTWTFSIWHLDLGTMKITDIDPPEAANVAELIELIATEDGRLGLASVEKTKLSLWSREAVVGGGRWALCRVIDLDKLIPMDAGAGADSNPYILVGSAEDTGVVFLTAYSRGYRLFSIDLWSGLEKHVYEREPPLCSLVFPYMAFFTPVLSRPPCTDGEPRASASNA